MLLFGAFNPDRMKKTSDTRLAAAGQRLLLIAHNPNGECARRLVLQQEGYVVTTCKNPDEALTRFKENAFDIVVVTDYRMPGTDGIELLAKLRTMRSGVPSVLISSMVDVLGLTETSTGADAVIAKNENEISNLVRAVNRLSRKVPKKPPSLQNGKRPPKTGSA